MACQFQTVYGPHVRDHQSPFRPGPGDGLNAPHAVLHIRPIRFIAAGDSGPGRAVIGYGVVFTASTPSRDEWRLGVVMAAAAHTLRGPCSETKRERKVVNGAYDDASVMASNRRGGLFKNNYVAESLWKSSTYSG
jgi:hypothetical protein